MRLHYGGLGFAGRRCVGILPAPGVTDEGCRSSSLSARRDVGHPRAHFGTEARRRTGQTIIIEQAGREWQRRRGVRREGSAGRLHEPALGIGAVDRRCVPDARLRPGEGFLAGDDGRIRRTSSRQSAGRQIPWRTGRWRRRSPPLNYAASSTGSTAPRGYRVRDACGIAGRTSAGARAITDVVGGRRRLFNGMLAMPHAKGGGCASSPCRRETCQLDPDVPTIAESGLGFETSSWQVSWPPNAARHRRPARCRGDGCCNRGHEGALGAQGAEVTRDAA